LWFVFVHLEHITQSKDRAKKEKPCFQANLGILQHTARFLKYKRIFSNPFLNF